MNWEFALGLLSAAASSWGAVGSLGWWLSGRFRAVELATARTIAQHEQIDQSRHEENLENFSRIRIILARNGINGNGHADGDYSHK
jgi:hypothetical protein